MIVKSGRTFRNDYTTASKTLFTRSVETVTAHVDFVSGTLVEAGYENEMLEEASQCHSRSLCVYPILDFRINIFGPFIPSSLENFENSVPLLIT